MSKMFDDLKKAIRDVLEGADNTGCEDCYVVDETRLRILQAEYNIHFVEPDDEQLDTL